MLGLRQSIVVLSSVFLAAGCAVQPLLSETPSERATLTSLSTSACAPAVMPLVTSEVQGCGNCGAAMDCSGCRAVQPVHAYAVTRPAQCNDFPVTYRVQVPDSDPRVRNVDFYMR